MMAASAFMTLNYELKVSLRSHLTSRARVKYLLSVLHHLTIFLRVTTVRNTTLVTSCVLIS